MNRTMRAVSYANRTGKCPICNKRARAIWFDTGQLRITCGHDECYLSWLPGGHEQHNVARDNAETMVADSDE